jgi:hypothetical protein
MKTNIMNRIAKSSYKVEDFGRGKSPASKARNRRAIKRASKTAFERMFESACKIAKQH